MSNLSALRDSLLSALRERKDNCERTARGYLADNRKEAAAQCRSAAGAVQECIEAVTNIMTAAVEVEPAHICGASGYNPMLGDRCPACEEQNNRVDSGKATP